MKCGSHLQARPAVSVVEREDVRAGPLDLFRTGDLQLSWFRDKVQRTSRAVYTRNHLPTERTLLRAFGLGRYLSSGKGFMKHSRTRHGGLILWRLQTGVVDESD